METIVDYKDFKAEKPRRVWVSRAIDGGVFLLLMWVLIWGIPWLAMQEWFRSPF